MPLETKHETEYKQIQVSDIYIYIYICTHMHACKEVSLIISDYNFNSTVYLQVKQYFMNLVDFPPLIHLGTTATISKENLIEIK